MSLNIPKLLTKDLSRPKSWKEFRILLSDLLMNALSTGSPKPDWGKRGVKKEKKKRTSRVFNDILHNFYVIDSILYPSMTDLVGSETRSGERGFSLTVSFKIGSYRVTGSHILGPQLPLWQKVPGVDTMFNPYASNLR